MRNICFQLFLQNVTEATVNMAYVTHRTLKTTTTNIIPKSGRVKIALQVKDERWQDQLEQWDKKSRTFTEVSLSLSLELFKISKSVRYDRFKNLPPPSAFVGIKYF